MPRTLVSFHAHPDDEVIATGGTLARASAEGHRVVLVVATRGELGEVVEGTLGPGEPLWERRVDEVGRSAELLGIHRVEFLGYHDSGMEGEPTNDAPECFWQADVEEAAARLAHILEDEQADVLTVYDDHGAYGHPDHIQVHRVGIRAAELAGTPRVYEATHNRDFIMRLVEAMPEDVPDLDASAVAEVGVTEDRLTTAVDVSDYVDVKRQALAAHATQIPPDSFFLSMPDELFTVSFGTEWFIRRDLPPGLSEQWLFDGLGG